MAPASASVWFSANYASGQDVLEFTPLGNITGLWNPATGVLSFSGSDTAANYQAVLRLIRYRNTSSTPSTLTRTIAFQGSDAVTAFPPVYRNLTVTAV